MVSVKKQMMKCSNPSCYASGSDTKLQSCSRCKITRYCSKQCQRTHWKTHKEMCDKNAAHTEALQSVFNPMNLIPLPDGMTLTELDARHEKWIGFHNPTFMGACIHALSLPRDITRSRTHVLHLTVAPRTDHGGSAAKYFRVRDAEPIAIAQAMTYDAPWPESLNDLKNLREENEKSGRGTVAAIGVVCPPLGVQIVPFGSLKDLSSLQVLPHWKDTLIRDVENGKKFTRFGY